MIFRTSSMAYEIAPHLSRWTFPLNATSCLWKHWPMGDEKHRSHKRSRVWRFRIKLQTSDKESTTWSYSGTATSNDLAQL